MNIDRSQLFNAILSPIAFKRLKEQRAQNAHFDSDLIKLPSIKKSDISRNASNNSARKQETDANQSKNPHDPINLQYSARISDEIFDPNKAAKDPKESTLKLDKTNYSAKELTRHITPTQAKFGRAGASTEALKYYSATPNASNERTKNLDVKDPMSTGTLRSFGTTYRAISDLKLVKTEAKEDYVDSALRTINSYQDRLKFLESYKERRRKINEMYSEKVHYVTPGPKPDWLAPFDSLKGGPPKRMTLPKPVPKLVVQASQAKITTPFDYIDQDENNLFVMKKPQKKVQKVSIATQFSYDQSGIMNYFEDFVQLVTVSKQLESFDVKEPSDNSERQQLVKRIQHIKQTLKPEEIITLPSNITEMQDFLKTRWIYICVMKDYYQDIFRNKGVSERILQALNIDYKQELFKVNWETFLLFNRGILNYELPRPELTNIVLKFFRGHESHISAAQLQLVFKALAQEYQNENENAQSVVDLITSLYKSWDELGILPLRAEFLNEAAFKNAYYNNKMNIQILLNLITHRL